MPAEQFQIRIITTGAAQTQREAAKSSAALRGVETQAKTTGQTAVTASQAMAASAVATGKKMTSAGKSMTRGLTLPITALAALTGKVAIDFDREMRNVNSIAQLSERNLAKVSDRVLALAGPTAQAPATLAAGLYDLVSSGFDAEESLQILEKSARAATAGLTTTETSTAAVAAVLNAYKLPAQQAGKVSDQLFRTVDRGVITFEQLAGTIGDVLPFSSALSIGLDEVGASVATMTKAGINPAETMTRIKAAMAALIKPSADLKKAIQEQGYETGEAMVEALGFQGTLEKLAEATGGSKEELGKLFPNIRALGGVLALTGKNAASANADLRGMADASGATSRALAQQSKSIALQWQELKAEASVLGITIGATLLPVFTDLFGVAADVIGAIDGLPPGLRETAIYGGLVLAALGPLVSVAGLLTTGIGRLAQGYGALNNALRLAPTALGVTALRAADAARGIGGLRAALSAVGAAMATNPLGLVALGVGAVATAVLLLRDNNDSAILSQEELAESADNVTAAMDRQRSAMQALRDFTLDLENAKLREKEAALQVEAAEKTLAETRRQHGRRSLEARQAEVNLARARLELRRASREANREEKSLPARIRESAGATREAEDAIKDRAVQLVDQREELRKAAREEERKHGQTVKLRRIESRIAETELELKEARRDLNRVTRSGNSILGEMLDGLKAVTPPQERNKEALRDYLRELSDSIGKTVKQDREQRKLSRTTAAFKNPLDDLIDQTGALSEESRKLGDNYRRTERVSGQAIGALERKTNSALGALGVKELNFGVGGRRARGGLARLPGQGREDTVPLVGPGFKVMAAPGEDVMIANRHQRPMLDAAVRDKYGVAGLPGFFNKYDRPHYAARGGFAQPPGDPGPQVVAASIAQQVGAFLRRFGLDLTAGYDPGGGHVSPGHNVTGTALDLVPGPGGSWDSVDAAVKWAVGRGMKVLYDGRYGSIAWPNHGRGNHAHIEWGGGGVGAGLAQQIQRVLITGPDGPLKDMAQAVSDKVRTAASRYADRQAGTAFGDHGAGPGRISDGEFIGYALRALRMTGKFAATRGNANRLLELARKESGLDPRSINDWDSNAAAGDPSGGLMHTTRSTFKAYHQPGTANSYFDPVASIAASINYQAARYGQLVTHSPYAKGGLVKKIHEAERRVKWITDVLTDRGGDLSLKGKLGDKERSRRERERDKLKAERDELKYKLRDWRERLDDRRDKRRTRRFRSRMRKRGALQNWRDRIGDREAAEANQRDWVDRLSAIHAGTNLPADPSEADYAREEGELRAELKALGGGRASLLSKQLRYRNVLIGGLDAERKRRRQFERELRDARGRKSQRYKVPIIRDALRSLREFRDSNATALESLQGRNSPMRPYKAAPPPPTLGGDILQTQLDIGDLQGQLGELRNDGTGTSASDNELAELLREQLTQAQQARAVTQAQFAVFEDYFSRAPVFHGGGIYRNPAGEGMAVLKDREGVFTPEQMAAMGRPIVYVIVEEGAGVDPNRIRAEVDGYMSDAISRARRSPRPAKAVPA